MTIGWEASSQVTTDADYGPKGRYNEHICQLEGVLITTTDATPTRSGYTVKGPYVFGPLRPVAHHGRWSGLAALLQ